jgi:hypothetical protein
MRERVPNCCKCKAKFYQERKPTKNPKLEEKTKNKKTILHPLIFPGWC